MKTKTPILSRFMAVLLSAVLAFSNAVPGLAVIAHAADKNASEASVVAGNYELTDAEKNLLNSGNLASGTIVYQSAESDWVTVDTDAKTITATAEKGWQAVEAYIKVGEEVKETIDLVETNVYTFDGNAFSVEVKYVLYDDVDIEVQEKLLNTAGWIKSGVAALEAGYETDTNLGVAVEAIPTMRKMANGIDLGWASAQFDTEAIAAVNALEAETKANDGKLDLQVMNEAYVAAGSETKFLLENGSEYKAVLVETYENISAIVNDPLCNNALLDSYLKSEDPSGYTKWMAFKNIMNNLAAALEVPANADWTAAEKGTDLVSSSVNYAGLDSLVAALGDISSVDVRNPLVIATETVKVNLSMYNVSVVVEMNEVKGIVDSDEMTTVVTEAVVVTLAEGATAEEVMAEAQKVIDEALGSWEAYEAEHFDAAFTELPEALDADIEFKATYTPKMYAVNFLSTEELRPYGYKMTLPRHEDAEQAYDYTVNGDKYAQGEVITIVGETTVTRSAGKSYVKETLYSVVANNYGDAVAKAILNSGALFGNEAINYRKPDPADAGSILKLVDGKLTAAEYGSDYAGLVWAPFTYGETGTENSFDEYTVDWTANEVKVQYILSFENFGQKKAQAVLDLAETLKAEAEAQKGALNSLAGITELEELDKAKFGAMNGVIGVTDFTPEDGTEDDAENLEMRKYFSEVVGKIIDNHIDVKNNNKLKVYTYVSAYKAEGDNGLAYYYQNADAIREEISKLAEYLGKMTDEEEALRILVTAIGYPHYAEKIADVETQLNGFLANLSAPNEAIDVESENLSALVAALNMEGTASCEATDAPYVLSEMLTAMDESQVNVQVMISTSKGSATVTTPAMDRGEVFTAEMAAELQALVDAKVAELLGDAKYYDVAVEGEEIEALVGTEINKQVNTYYNYTAKEYTVVIEGEADQIITVEKLSINLPKHGEADWEYRYTIDGVEGITASAYTFTLAQIDSLFVDGSYTIVREAANVTDEKLDATFGEWLVKEGDKVVAIHADINGDQDGLMEFVNVLINSGYTYIAINDAELLYMNADNVTEVKLQTLIDAIIKDETFSSEKLTKLGKNGKGEIIRATMDLGNDADDLQCDDIEFTLTFNTVPGQMRTVANGLEKVKGYLTFESVDGALDVNVNLPEKIYEAYLAALLATGNAEKSDMNAINSEIALMFLWDYIDLIINSDVNTTTLTNTLAKLGVNYDLTGAEDYYQLVKTAFKDGLEVNAAEGDGEFDVVATAKGQDAIDSLIGMLGMDISAYETYIKMIYEYKNNVEIVAPARVNLVNTDYGFEAVVIDVRASETTNKFDFTDNLAKRAKEINGEAIIMLLEDVDADLVLNDATIIDLNGKTINGSVKANGKTLIFDSGLSTYNCGGVTGSVSGNVTVVGGKYSANVTAFVPEGYMVEDGVVRNILYTVSDQDNSSFRSYALAKGGKKVTFNLDIDVLNKDIASYTEAAAVIGIDLAIDLVLNYFTSASVTVDGAELYNITVEDIIGIFDSADRKEALIEEVIDFVSIDELNKFVNGIIDKMLDFKGISNAMRNNEPFMTFGVDFAPVSVDIRHETAGDYLTVDIKPDNTRARHVDFGVKLEDSAYTGAGVSAKEDAIINVIEVLADVTEKADAQVTINKPSFANNNLKVSGSAEAEFIFDVTVDHDDANAVSFTAEEYVNVFAVAVAHGNKGTKTADALVKAINSGKNMKAAIDAVTVEDVFDALKKLGKDKSFNTMASEVGVDMSKLGNEANLEKIYHLLLTAAGAGLDQFEINGPKKAMGGIYNEATGRYEIELDSVAGEVSASASGYTVTAAAELESLLVAVKLFEETVAEHVCTPAEAVRENVVPATCKAEGSYDEVVYCSECGKELSRETKTIAKLDHVPAEAVKENEVPATCKAEGSYDEVVYCSECGEELSRVTKTIDKLSHTEATKEIDRVEATCTEDGSYKVVTYCSVCFEVIDEETFVIPALGHTEVKDEAVAPTCTETGLTEGFHCSVCGEVLIAQQVVPALGHTEVIVPAVAPTCTETGLTEGKYCSVCGEVIVAQDVVPALGHTEGVAVVENKVAADCENDGSYDEVVYCSVCGEELSRNTVVVPALGHDYKYETTKAPTCTEKGEFRKYCANGCGEEEFGEIDALGHDWGRWVVVKPATYYSTGLMKRCCERCSECETREIPKLVKPDHPEHEEDEEDRTEDENPSTGAPYVGSALAAIAVLAGAAVVIEKARKR